MPWNRFAITAVPCLLLTLDAYDHLAIADSNASRHARALELRQESVAAKVPATRLVRKKATASVSLDTGGLTYQIAQLAVAASSLARVSRLPTLAQEHLASA